MFTSIPVAHPLEDITSGQPAALCNAHTSTARLARLNATVFFLFQSHRHDDAIPLVKSILRAVKNIRLPDAEAKKQCKALLRYAQVIRENPGENFAENEETLKNTVQDVESHLATLRVDEE